MSAPADSEMSSPADADGGVIRLDTIRESPRTPGRYQVQLSDGRKFVVGIATLSELGLTRQGRTLGPGIIARLEREHVVTSLISRAVAMLARARRTTRELERRLLRIEPDRLLVAEALRRLHEQGALDDSGVARAEATARLRRGEGPARVRQQLRRKGLDDATTTGALRSAIDDEAFDELAACRRVAERRFRSLVKLEPDVAKRRLMAFLQRRGYGGALVRQVTKELLSGS